MYAPVEKATFALAILRLASFQKRYDIRQKTGIK